MIRLCILILEAHVNLKDLFLINNLRKVFKEARSTRRLLLSQNYPQSQFVHLRKTDHRAQSVSRPAGQFARCSSISAQDRWVCHNCSPRSEHGNCGGEVGGSEGTFTVTLSPILLRLPSNLCLLCFSTSISVSWNARWIIYSQHFHLFYSFNQLNVAMQLALEHGLLLGDFFFFFCKAFPSCFGVKCGDTQSKTNQINFACWASPDRAIMANRSHWERAVPRQRRG